MSLTAACNRARQWISLEVDGDVSQIERAMLANHLDGCQTCRVFASDVSAFHRMLSETPMEALSRPIELPRRARTFAFSRVAVVAPAAAAIVALGVGVGAWQARRPVEASSSRVVPIATQVIRIELTPGQPLADIQLKSGKVHPVSRNGPVRAE